MASVPGPPILVQPRPKALNERLDFWWQAPASDGGSPITGYILNNGTISTIVSESTFYTYVTGLTNGTAYQFTIAASNAIGVGPEASFRLVQPGNKPQQPTSLSYSQVSSTYYNISWTNPTDVGQAALTRILLRAYPYDVNNLPVLDSNLIIKKPLYASGAGLSQTQLINLTSNYNYKVLVSAVNDPGYSLPYSFTNMINFITPPDFSPSTFTGIQLWLDATDTTTYSTNSTSNVVRWNSKGPTSIILSSITGKPLGTYPFLAGSTLAGNSTIRFTGTSLLRQGVTYDSTIHLFWVGQQGTQTDYPILFGHDTNYDWHAEINDPKRFVDATYSQTTIRNASTFFFGNTSNFSNTFTSIPFPSTNTAFMFSAYNMNAPSRWQGLTFDRTFQGRGWVGNLGEIITYSNTLTPNQRLAVEGYLAWKWGLSTLLPTYHPFYYRKPLPSDSNLDFSPSSIAGVKLWLDAADPTTFVVSSATSTILRWNDKSGAGNNMMATGTPILSTNHVFLNGTNAYFSTIGFTETAITNMFVFTPINTEAWLYTTRIGSGAGQSYTGFCANGGGSVAFAQNDSTWLSATGMTTNTLALAGTQYYGLNSTMIAYSNTSNLIVSTQSGTLTRDRFIIGSRQVISYTNYMQGRINEVLHFSTILSPVQRQQAEGYLAWKWGLESKLPLSHLYYFRPPTKKDVFVPFSPSSINGLQLWLDAADASSFTYSGNLITQWSDKSGNNNHAYSGGSNIRVGDGGISTVQISTTSFFSTTTTFSINQLSWLYVVFKMTYDPSTINTLIRFPPNDYSIRFENSILKGTPSSGGNSGDFGNNQYWVNGTFNPSVTSNTFTSSYGLVNAQSILNSNGRLSIADYPGGLNRWFRGNVAEVLLFNGTSSIQNRQNIEGYLAWKWGLQSNLPPTHPYRYFSSVSLGPLSTMNTS